MISEHSIAARASMLRGALLALLQDAPTDNGDRGNKQERDALLEAHLAEYEAITTRNTHWLTLQYALFPILGAGLAVLAQIWSQFDNDPTISQAHRIIIWLAIVFINIIITSHTEVGCESYNNVAYLENELRSKILDLFRMVDSESKNAVFGYETFRRKQREKGLKMPEIAGPIISVVMLASGAAILGGIDKLFGYLYPWTIVENVAVPINAALFIWIVLVTVKMIRKRREIGHAPVKQLRQRKRA